MILLLKEHEKQVIKQRDEALQKVELQYMQYFSSLLQQKLFVTAKIRQQYDDIINAINYLLYLHINQYTITTDALMSGIAHLVHTNSNHISIKPLQCTVADQVISSKKQKQTAPNTENPPFKAHMTLQEADKLCINDRIDHRDLVGCAVGAVIVDKKESNLKINYEGWSDEWDVWSDYKTELHRFAEYKSISQRPRHRFFDIKEGDRIDINPIRHKGWKTAPIVDVNEYGQIKVAYNTDNNDYFHFVWAHVDNEEEVAALHTHTPRIDQWYECIFCDASCKSYDKLRNHVQIDHSERSHLCSYCPQAFQGKRALNIHETQHKMYHSYKCSHCPELFGCDASFRDIGALKRHVTRVHKITVKSSKIDVTPHTISQSPCYECIYCVASYSNNKDLKNHIQTDHSDREHYCSYCPQAFWQKVHMEKHEKQHTDSHKFKCSHCLTLFGCNTSFSTCPSLTRHTRRVHNIVDKSASVSGHKRKRSKQSDTKISKEKLMFSKGMLNEMKEKQRKYDVLNCRLVKEWVVHKKQLEVDYKSMWNGYLFRIRKIKEELKKYIINNDLCKQWRTSWDALSVVKLEQDVFHNLCAVSLRKANTKHPTVTQESLAHKHPPITCEESKTMIVGELRAALRKRGMDATGTKKMLLERIKQHSKQYNRLSASNVGHNSGNDHILLDMPDLECA